MHIMHANLRTTPHSQQKESMPRVGRIFYCSKTPRFTCPQNGGCSSQIRNEVIICHCPFFFTILLRVRVIMTLKHNSVPCTSNCKAPKQSISSRKSR